MSTSILWLIFFWLLFFALHSLTASQDFKKRAIEKYPGLHPRYRLLYNLVAAITVLPAIAMGWFTPSASLWSVPQNWEWLYWVITLICLVGAWVASQHYNMQTFLGFRSDSTTSLTTPEEPFALSPLHRFVRHPWYFLGLILIWMQNMSLHWLVSCVMMTGYFWYGSRLEDRKLIEYYGETYRTYSGKVPGLFPWPGKALSRREADELQKSARAQALSE